MGGFARRDRAEASGKRRLGDVGVGAGFLCHICEFARGKEGVSEGFLEGELIRKVVHGVRVLFAKHAFFDEVEDHFTDVGALSDAPFAEEGQGHGAEFLQGEIAEAKEKFFPADVAVLAVVFFLCPLQGEVECVLEKEIGPGLEAVVFFQNLIHSCVES